MISYEKITGYNNNKEGTKCMVCNHYYFKDKFNYQPYVCNTCHDYSITVMDLSDFFVLKIGSIDYRVYISNIDKKEAIIIFKKSNLDDKEYYKWNFIQKDFIQILVQQMFLKKVHLEEHILEIFTLM